MLTKALMASRLVAAVSLAAWLIADGSRLAAQSSAGTPAQRTPIPAPSAAPPTRIFPRPGNFFPPPTGAGYYSLLDHVRGEERPSAPRSGYPASAIMAPGFFDANFAYLEGAPPENRRPFERLKRIRLSDEVRFSTGGTAWYRFHDEGNSRLTETDQSYSLGLIRAYGDISYQDRFRVYGEFITAGRTGGGLPALPVDNNQADLLNAFADVKLLDLESRPAYVRVGRQEMLLGSQRLVSPLPWANQRRNFDGIRVFRQGQKVDVDAFWLRPVVPSKSDFDTWNDDVYLIGAWLTYRPKAGHFADAYYLYSDFSNTAVQQGIPVAPSHSSTIGTRYSGDHQRWLWDAEAALQFGERGDDGIAAGMVTAGIGRHFAGAPMNPTLWFYYDYASGDDNPGDDDASTFNQLFPFGHYYLGWTDIIGRQNLRDANVHLGFYPVHWVQVWIQYHHLSLDKSRDALYNAGGAGIRRDPTGAAGTHVADDVDVVANLHIDAQSDVLVAFARAFGGGFLEGTANAARASSTRALYLIYNFRW